MQVANFYIIDGKHHCGEPFRSSRLPQILLEVRSLDRGLLSASASASALLDPAPPAGHIRHSSMLATLTGELRLRATGDLNTPKEASTSHLKAERMFVSTLLISSPGRLSGSTCPSCCTQSTSSSMRKLSVTRRNEVTWVPANLYQNTAVILGKIFAAHLPESLRSGGQRSTIQCEMRNERVQMNRDLLRRSFDSDHPRSGKH
jgi:hypothetical protein